MLVVADYPDREFRIWRYMTSFSQLLLRSAKTELHTTQIDVVLFSVDWVNIPVFMSGFTLARAQSEQDLAALRLGSAQSFDIDRTFIVRGKEFFGFVVATDYAVDESEHEYNDPDIWGIYPGLKGEK